MAYKSLINPHPIDRMNPEVKKLWVEALRRPETEDGYYIQTFGVLTKKRVIDGVDCFCANGVLKNLAVEVGVTTWAAKNDRANVFLDKKTLAWAGLDTEYFTYAEKIITRMNDLTMTPFPEIAGWIERNM